MSNVFEKFCNEINYEITDSFKGVSVVSAKLGKDNIFKIKFKSLKSIDFNDMLKFILKVNNNFKYKIDLSFEVVSPSYNLEIINDYAFWILKSYLKKPLQANAFLSNKKELSVDGKMVLFLHNSEMARKFNNLKKDLERILKKFGFHNFSFETEMLEEKDFLKEEYDLIKQNAQISFREAENMATNAPKEAVKSYRQYEPCEIDKLAVSEFNRVETTGVIFKRDEFKTKTGLVIITLGITNNIDAVEVKLFAKNDKQIIHYKKFEIGNWVDIRGDYQIDAYSKKPVIICSTIKGSKKSTVNRTDDFKRTKRVELGARTRMSTMDGIVTAKELVDRAISWGHKAIAIVDSESVQSFPEFYLSTKGKDIKAIYGISLPALERENKAIFAPKKVELAADKYVIFDLETTGLSARNDNIIEFGAVKIENNKIVDKLQFFIKPTKEIPEKITKITNITNEMVANAISEKKAIEKIVNYFEDYTLVAHNASFDYHFIQEKLFKYGFEPIQNASIDTLVVARITHGHAKKFRLETVAKRYGVSYDSTTAHRADYDADVLARIWIKMIIDLNDLEINTQEALVDYSSPNLYSKQFTYEVSILAKNQEGLRDLFKLVSLSSTKQLFKNPTIFYDQLTNQDNLLIGNSSLKGKLHEVMINGSTEQLENEVKKYDYIEILPIDDYKHLFKDYSKEDIQQGIKLLISLAKKHNKIVVATGDVRYLDPSEKIYHEVYINAKGLGGKNHYLKRYNDYSPVYPDQFFRTTQEMLKQFSWLDNEELINEIVVENSVKIAKQVDDDIEVIKSKLYTPKMENSGENLKKVVFDNAKKLYGDPLPEIVKSRIEREITPIEEHGFDIIYWISHLLVSKSLGDGYLVGSRGSVGSSFVATLANITEVNPLDPHYLCSECKFSEFFVDSELNSGYDLPNKLCPKCNILLKKEGQKIPFETFLGFNADKVPDIDLNFSGEYQNKIHQEVKNIFGEQNAFRAGTISTVAEKTAFGYVKSWAENTNRNISPNFIEYLAKKIAGTKRTSGQHPGGIIVIPGDMVVEDFSPINFPANDKNADWKTTHFDFHAIHDNVLKLDLLGHDDPTAIKYLEKLTGINAKVDIPFSDERVISLFSSTATIGIKPEDIDGETTGAMGIPEFGTNFVRRMLTKAKVSSFGDLIALSGLSHGTDVWAGNAEKMVKEKGKTLSEVISCRDNIMTDLIAKNVDPLQAFQIMEKVRKGKGITAEEEKLLLEHDVEDWYIESLQKIKYMFPKAHATAYVMMAWRIAWFKIYHPIAYYATYFTARSDVFDIETILKGKDFIKEKLKDFKRQKGKRGPDALSNKEVALIPIFELVLEAMARGIKIANIDMNRSKAANWIIEGDELIPPFSVLDGLGKAAAESVVIARETKPFSSVEDVKKRTSINKTNLDKLETLGVLKEFSASNQIEFDLFGL